MECVVNELNHGFVGLDKKCLCVSIYSIPVYYSSLSADRRQQFVASHHPKQRRCRDGLDCSSLCCKLLILAFLSSESVFDHGDDHDDVPGGVDATECMRAFYV